MNTLSIDTANQTLAVALTDGEKVLASLTLAGQKNHSTALMPSIEELCRQAQIAPEALEKIVVAEGPGSYTGLRIGVTTAKTLAYALDIPLVGVSSLASLAQNYAGSQQLLVPLFDARRGNVYTGAYRFNDGVLKEVLADRHISLDHWLELVRAEDTAPLFIGADSATFKDTLTALFGPASISASVLLNTPNGVSLALLGNQRPLAKSVIDFVPHYLKRVEAEENWLMQNPQALLKDEQYVEKI